MPKTTVMSAALPDTSARGFRQFGTDLDVRRAPGGTPSTYPIDTAVGTAIDDVRAGRPVVVIDDQTPDRPAGLVLAAAHADAARVAFMTRHTDGLLEVPMPASELDRLHLCADRAAISVDADSGTGRRGSAADRAHTIALLADAGTRPQDLRRPGHVFPVPVSAAGVLGRAEYPEAAVDLTRWAGLCPVAVVGEVINDDGSPAEAATSHAFATRHGLTVVSISSLVTYRFRHDGAVRMLAETRMPTRYGLFRALGFRSMVDGADHVALVAGDLGAALAAPPLVRIQTECLIGDTFRARSCECGPQLRWAMRTVAQRRGVVIYVRATAGSTARLGLGAQILHSLGLDRIRLLTNDPTDSVTLARYGVGVAASVTVPTEGRGRCPLW